MANFASNSAAAPEDPSVDGEAGADAGGDFDEGEVSRSAACTPPQLGQRAHVGIVVDEYGPSKALVEVGRDVVALPLRRDQRQQLAWMLTVDGAWNRHPDAEHT